MKIFTELIVFHQDMPMPEEGKFCPALWAAEDFDSDGDYYYDNIEGRWTQLEIVTRYKDGRNSKLEIDIYRENNQNYKPRFEAELLAQYIQLQEQGYFDLSEGVGAIKNAAVASFKFETFRTEHYQDFLNSVHYFLDYSKGYIVNNGMCLSAGEFAEDFLR